MNSFFTNVRAAPVLVSGVLLGQLGGINDNPRRAVNLVGSSTSWRLTVIAGANPSDDSRDQWSDWDYPPLDITSGSGTRRDVARKCSEGLTEPCFLPMRLRSEHADGLDGRLESGLPLAKINLTGNSNILVLSFYENELLVGQMEGSN